MPPHGLIVYSERADGRLGLRAFAQELASAGWTLPSVNGLEPYCTDLGNSTAKRFYQKIGYRPICDYTVYSF